MRRTAGYKVAVIGGGIFGSAAAVALGRAGHRVTLFEQMHDILQGASRTNHRRLHHGYHYPRSIETAIASQRSLEQFRTALGDSVVDGEKHFVAISRQDSLTSVDDYLSFCNEVGLPVFEEWPPFLRHTTIDWCTSVPEASIDIGRLRALFWRQFGDHRVDTRLNQRATLADLDAYERVVVAAYAGSNLAMVGSRLAAPRYRFEVCEKPIVQLPTAFHGVSVLVLDGPFVNLNPFGRPGEFMLGDVLHGKHSVTTGVFSLTPAGLIDQLDQGVVKIDSTHFERILGSFRRYFLGLENAEYRGSMFTTRTLLPDTGRTAARPSLVTRVDERTVVVLGGKLGTCIEAGQQVVDELASR
jgi:hypothetical protein